MHLLELERFGLLLSIEGSKVLDNSVSVWVLEAEQLCVEHGVSCTDEAKAYPRVQSFFDDWTMGLRDLAFLLVEWFSVIHCPVVLCESRV